MSTVKRFFERISTLPGEEQVAHVRAQFRSKECRIFEHKEFIDWVKWKGYSLIKGKTGRKLLDEIKAKVDDKAKESNCP